MPGRGGWRPGGQEVRGTAAREDDGPGVGRRVDRPGDTGEDCLGEVDFCSNRLRQALELVEGANAHGVEADRGFHAAVMSKSSDETARSEVGGGREEGSLLRSQTLRGKGSTP